MGSSCRLELRAKTRWRAPNLQRMKCKCKTLKEWRQNNPLSQWQENYCNVKNLLAIRSFLSSSSLNRISLLLALRTKLTIYLSSSLPSSLSLSLPSPLYDFVSSPGAPPPASPSPSRSSEDDNRSPVSTQGPASPSTFADVSSTPCFQVTLFV